MMDNASAHKSKMVRALGDLYKIHLVFPPPYTPQYCPVEMAFSRLKSVMKSYYITSKESHATFITNTACGFDSSYLWRLLSHTFTTLAEDINT